jgi:hypothetical protein
MSIELSTKAETLFKLEDKGLNIPKVFFFTYRDWRNNGNGITDEIIKLFNRKTHKLIVRSSSIAEDQHEKSMAGAFQSVLDVDSRNRQEIIDSVETVVKSYSGDPNDQILIQPMVKNITASGVILTRCLDDGSPYYVISYDDNSGKTDTVTGGKGISKTVYVYKGFKDTDFDSARVNRMVNFARNLEKIFDGMPLDIEFGIDNAGNFHLFQVRQICTAANWAHNVVGKVSKKILLVEEFIKEILKSRPSIFGEKTILGAMPDWNPAEIIGTNPRPLAASLYREIITRRVWSRAREEMGYRPMPPEELMVLVSGRPYIDVRNSFNSFLPKGLDGGVATKLVDAWLDRLCSHPELHDKVEFEIAHTVHDFCFNEYFQKRYPRVLNQTEFSHFKACLQDLTKGCLDIGKKGTLYSAEKAIALLANSQENRKIQFKEFSPFRILVLVKALLEECIELGTKPFAILARHAFIAEAFIRSAIYRSAIHLERVDHFKRTIRTISRNLSDDLAGVTKHVLDKDVFIKKYGHLRPGTYDILSPRYADRKDLFEDCVTFEEGSEEIPKFEITSKERHNINRLLKELNLSSFRAHHLFEYTRRAIVGREYGKFVFSKNLSDAIECIAVWGENYGLSREELSFLKLQDIVDVLISSPPTDTKRHFKGLIQHRREVINLSSSIKLSYLIRSVRDVYVVPQHRSTPNFVTSKRLEGKPVYLKSNETFQKRINDAIICIENADPGFDWIFAKGISGLITKYGGANSHMAIRCAEYGLPAAIGCGEVIFQKIQNATKCELNCGEKILRPI